MMRRPYFAFHAPRTVGEAADLLAAHGSEAMLIAGGRGLPSHLKRREQVPRTLISLRRVAELRQLGSVTLGAGLTLTEIVRDRRLRAEYGALWQAASQIATPQLL